MKVIICIDYSAYTEKVLQAAKLVFSTRIPPAELSVIHILDEKLIFSGKNQEEELNILKANSRDLNELAKQYLGNDFLFIEERGVPQLKIEEILGSLPYDLLVIGTRGRTLLENVLFGSVAEHLLHHIKKPLLVVP